MAMSALSFAHGLTEADIAMLDDETLELLGRLVEAAQENVEHTVVSPDAWIAIYVRRSPKSRNGTNERSVAEQEAEARAKIALVPALAGVPIVLYSDNNKSGHDRKVRRLGWERMRRDIRAGNVRAVVAWDQRRLTRADEGRSSWATFRRLCERGGVEAIYYAADADITFDGGSAVGDKVKAIMNSEEVKATKLAVHRTFASRVAKGLPKNGLAPYGYEWGFNDDGDRTFLVVPERATVVREIADRLIAGETGAAICRDLTGRGVESPRGGEWAPGMLRRLITTPRLAGYHAEREDSTRKRLIAGDRGRWEPILSDETWRAVLRVFNAPAPGPTGGTRTRRPFAKHLLSGMLTCGRCGHSMSGVLINNPGPKGTIVRKQFYKCATPKRGGCGMSSAFGIQIDAEIGRQVRAICDNPALVALLSQDTHSEARDAVVAAIREAEADQAEYRALATAGKMRPTVVADIAAGIDERLGDLQAKLNDLAPPPGIDFAAIAAAWDTPGEVELKRSVVAAIFARITLTPPPGSGRHTWSPALLNVTYTIDPKDTI